MQITEAYNQVNKKWKSTCKLLLNLEPKDLEKYKEWLKPEIEHGKVLYSFKSKRLVFFTATDYPDFGKCLSYEEVAFNAKFPPLSINQIKDIDSIVEAIQDRLIFAGNVILGNSGKIANSSNITDSFFVYECKNSAHSKYIAYSEMTMYSEYIFGSYGIGYSSFCIKPASSMKLSRTIEAIKCGNSSDIYYCSGVENCRECFFCFNVENYSYAIGNLKLSKDKYFSIKKKLIEDLKEILIKENRLPTLFEIASKEKPDYSLLEKMQKIEAAKEEQNIEIIEKAFNQTTKIVLKKPLYDIKKYENWLLRHSRKYEKVKSCFSGKEIILPDHTHFLLMPKDRVLTEQEAEKFGALFSISISDAERLRLSNAPQIISKIAFFSPEWKVENCKNNILSYVIVNSTDTYKLTLPINAKKCACGYWHRDSENIFGGNGVRSSSFSIKNYRSEKMNRCFECDSCYSSSDTFYSHNCQNLQDCMFCFNFNNARYAIGNTVFSKEQYLKTKENILEQILSDLEKNKSTRSIFDLVK